ncbi:MAG TPA: hypothetical protein VKU01_27255 [Bryobacteraceae bacterium]|nr:hypothetical protein [Bryobacteraceae bacterium]
MNLRLVVALLGVIALAIGIAYLPGATGFERLALAAGYALLIVLFIIGAVILADLVTGKIDLSELLEEVDGGASMSRFQLLIFTFVIAFSLFMIVAAKPSSLPDIPNSVIMLLGISGSTYAVAKGIHMGNSNPSNSESDKSQPGGDTHAD